MLSESATSENLYDYKISYAQRQGQPYGSSPDFEIFDEELHLNGEKQFSRAEPDYFLNDALGDRIESDVGVFAAIRRQGAREAESELEGLARDISRITRFRLNPFALSAPSLLPEVGDDTEGDLLRVRLGYEGENLAALLFELSERDKERFEYIRSVLQEAVTGFDTFEFNTVGTEKIGLSVRYSDSRDVVSAPSVSHGTLTLIGLITLLHQPNRPPVVILEEPENGLTPGACLAVYAMIKHAVADVDNPCQVIFSSHSPFVVCNLWNGEDRSFIRQVNSTSDGDAKVVTFTEWVKQSGVHLSKVKGEREHLSLKLAEQLMSGYESGA